MGSQVTPVISPRDLMVAILCFSGDFHNPETLLRLKIFNNRIASGCVKTPLTAFI